MSNQLSASFLVALTASLEYTIVTFLPKNLFEQFRRFVPAFNQSFLSRSTDIVV